MLSRDPLALLIGMVLDQQITIEKAFSSPAELARRLGGPLDAAAIAAMDPDELAAVFKERPALHRYPGSMAGRVQEVCRAVAEDYGGKADAIWKGRAQRRGAGGPPPRRCPGSGSRRPGSSPPCSASSSACAPRAGARPPPPTATTGATSRWPTSPTPRASTKVRATKKAMKAQARAEA